MGRSVYFTRARKSRIRPDIMNFTHRGKINNTPSKYNTKNLESPSFIPTLYIFAIFNGINLLIFTFTKSNESPNSM